MTLFVTFSGLPHYFYSNASNLHAIEVDCTGTIVMTSFVLETVRAYQIDSYRDLCLDAFSDSKWIRFCRTPKSTEGTPGLAFDEEEFFTPGDFLEMFDHKLNKVYRHLKTLDTITGFQSKNLQPKMLQYCALIRNTNFLQKEPVVPHTCALSLIGADSIFRYYCSLGIPHSPRRYCF